MRRLAWLLLAMALLLAALPAAAQDTVTVLFSHDMHSHLTPVPDGDGMRGGFARLKTLIDRETEAAGDVLLLDAGDFAMGTLFQTVYETDALELMMMAHLGYDAVTLGNHEYDYEGTGLANMLRAAMKNAEAEGVALPALLCANIDWTSVKDAHGEAMQAAMTEYGAKERMIIEHDGVKIGVFGMMGADSVDCAPLAPVTFIDTITCAKEQAAALKREGAELIICLSHSGVWAEADRSEDELLAKAVPEIDLIISGHTHTTLNQPIVHGSTAIASCGEYTMNLGRIVLERSGDRWRVAEYALIPTTDDVQGDAQIDERLAAYRERVDENYFSSFGYSYDQVLCRNPGELLSERWLLADAVVEAVKAAEGDAYEPIALAVVPDGVIRSALPVGGVTASDAFNVLSLGIGSDRKAGYPLVNAYLTGRELYDLAEVDASVSQIMGGTHLYASGGGWAYESNRLILSRVSDVWLDGENGERVPLEMDKLYRVVADMYSAQMLSTVKSKSFGLLSLEPKDAQGNPVTDFTAAIVRDGQGKEVKAWTALADYLHALGGEDGSGSIPAQYQQEPEGIVIGRAESIGDHFRHAGRIWYVLGGVLLALIAAIALMVLGVRAVIRCTRRRRAKK
ncbi:MAG: bifunctional metallophosphatase/5'-nucleotidase [Clostridia bacterium]|nr:bifunctional metallophosphatase/5'-nucleotidase [Clostridia bacterium]